MRKLIKVAVTGAAGQIGYALLFRIASGQMFGADTELEFQLLELEPALPALRGIVMELDDCAFPLLKDVRATSSVDEAMRGVNWAVLVGTIPRKAGMDDPTCWRSTGRFSSSRAVLSTRMRPPTCASSSLGTRATRTVSLQ